VLIALAFAFITGTNDGATLVAINLTNPAVRPPIAIGMLAAAVVVIPMVVGTAVADTFARAAWWHSQARTKRGISCSPCWPPPASSSCCRGSDCLGLGVAIAWATVGVVLLVAMIALLLSVVAGLRALRLLARSPARRRAWVQLRVVGAASVLLQSIAYAANDGQKMLAVLAIALGLGVGGRVVADPLALLSVGIMFALGTLFGIERLASRLSRRVLPIRVPHVVAAELASSATVLGSAAFGVPVSMIHASTAALVGAAMSDTIRRVRWEEASRIALAWLLTLPAAALAGAGIALAVGTLSR